MPAFSVCLCAGLALAQFQLVRPLRGPVPEVAARVFETEPWLVLAPEGFRKQWVELSGESLAEQRDRFIERYGIVWHREPRLVDIWILKSRGPLPESPEPLPRSGPRLASGPTWTQLDCATSAQRITESELAPVIA